MCVRRGVLSSLPVACPAFAEVCTRNRLKKNCGITILDLSIGNLVGPQMAPSQTVSSCGLNLQSNHDLAIGDLAVEVFGVHAIESLDVRVHVATDFVKMMKRTKVVRNRSSNSDSTILISLAICRRMVFAVFFSFFGI